MTIVKIPCPFVYATGKKCKGFVARVEAFKADLEWAPNDEGKWTFEVGPPRSHYHVYCSAKESHAGLSQPDSDQLKFDYRDLPDELRAAMAEAEGKA